MSLRLVLWGNEVRRVFRVTVCIQFECCLNANLLLSVCMLACSGTYFQVTKSKRFQGNFVSMVVHFDKSVKMSHSVYFQRGACNPEIPHTNQRFFLSCVRVIMSVSKGRFAC